MSSESRNSYRFPRGITVDVTVAGDREGTTFNDVLWVSTAVDEALEDLVRRLITPEDSYE